MLQIKKKDLNRILDTADHLINEVEQALSQDDIAQNRMEQIESGKVKGMGERDLDLYLRKRGI